MRGVYFSTAIDSMDPQEVADAFLAAEAQLRAAGLRLVNRELGTEVAGVGQQTGTPQDIVRRDLSLLRDSDFLLADLSLAGHTYVGCVCEIVYAYLWSKPVVVCVGSSGNDSRPWLKFHASHMCTTLREAVDWIRNHHFPSSDANK